MAEPREELTAEQWREKTENARRAARYTYARRQIKKIVAGTPPFTDEQLSGLAAELQAGGR